MHIGVHTPQVFDRPIEEALEPVSELGASAVEPGVGGHPGKKNLPPEEFLDDERRQAELARHLDEYDLSISALATHNNPLHPDEDRAAEADADLRTAIRLADQLGVDCVTCFSGLPGGAPGDSVPNWVTATWPPEHSEALAYQWEVATDYWSDVANLARDHGIDLAVEMHPNMLVHEPHGMVRLREATNDNVGANFDPSHLYWQGVDVPAAIRYLGDAIHHVHAKDTAIYETVKRTKGVLDTEPGTDESDRSWIFRTVGYGHGESHWKDLVSTLRLVGYDGALSIEHEDSLMGHREGLTKAVDVLERAIVESDPDETFRIG